MSSLDDSTIVLFCWGYWDHLLFLRLFVLCTLAAVHLHLACSSLAVHSISSCPSPFFQCSYHLHLCLHDLHLCLHGLHLCLHDFIVLFCSHDLFGSSLPAALHNHCFSLPAARHYRPLSTACKSASHGPPPSGKRAPGAGSTGKNREPAIQRVLGL